MLYEKINKCRRRTVAYANTMTEKRGAADKKTKEKKSLIFAYFHHTPQFRFGSTTQHPFNEHPLTPIPTSLPPSPYFIPNTHEPKTKRSCTYK